VDWDWAVPVLKWAGWAVDAASVAIDGCVVGGLQMFSIEAESLIDPKISPFEFNSAVECGQTIETLDPDRMLIEVFKQRAIGEIVDFGATGRERLRR
jgi:hypothetical protein